MGLDAEDVVPANTSNQWKCLGPFVLIVIGKTTSLLPVPECTENFVGENSIVDFHVILCQASNRFNI